MTSTFEYNKTEEVRAYAEERILDYADPQDGSLSFFNPEDGDYSEAHHELFNTDYYIIGRYKAIEWLESAENVFDVIQTVKDYELDNYGETFTYMEEPERLVNMYVFILGEQVIVQVIDEHMSRIEKS